jgi:formylglycine-generating enzyme required for sulfatase activity
MNRPVENISGYDCIAFLNALSRLENLDECYRLENGKWTCDFSKNGYRLPTLPEWEYAARGGSLSRGYKYSGSNRIGEVGWYDGNSGGHAYQVGLLEPNELGLYDMSGNVREWCWDWYGTITAVTPAAGAVSGSGRVLRGGSCNLAFSCAVSFRDYEYPFRGCGFRVVRSSS